VKSSVCDLLMTSKLKNRRSQIISIMTNTIYQVVSGLRLARLKRPMLEVVENPSVIVEARLHHNNTVHLLQPRTSRQTLIFIHRAQNMESWSSLKLQGKLANCPPLDHTPSTAMPPSVRRSSLSVSKHVCRFFLQNTTYDCGFPPPI